MTQGTLFARATDPDTCQPVSPEHRASLTDRIIAAHQAHLDGLTDSELCALIADRHEGTVKTCRSRLMREGFFYDTDTTRPNERGRPEIVWRLT